MLHDRIDRKTLRDENGSAMTEFVIGLPVFILLFLGILNMHSLGLGAVLVKGRAHAKMWHKAIDIQTAYMPEWSMHPVLAAGQAVAFHNATGGNALDYALDASSGLAAATGLSGGIMAESYTRVKPVDFVENIGVANEKVTWNINQDDYLIVNPDSISNSLMNDAIDWGAFSGVDSALSALNSVVDFTGARPAIAAGVRYGISGDYQTDTVKIFGGPTVQLEARSHVANAPRPTSRYITFAMVRLAMAAEDRYDTAIAFTLLPSLEGPGPAADATQGIEEYEACQNANSGLPAEEQTDCGDEPSVDGSDAADAANDLWDNIDCRGSWCG